MKKFTGICLAAALLTGCAIDPYTGEQKVSNTAWGAGLGAAGGAAIGAIAGGGKGALIGAAAGTAVGAGTGYYFDRQESQLRARLEGESFTFRPPPRRHRRSRSTPRRQSQSDHARQRYFHDQFGGNQQRFLPSPGLRQHRSQGIQRYQH